MSLRGASIDVKETFVPFGGPETILLKPSRSDAAGPPLDPVGLEILTRSFVFLIGNFAPRPWKEVESCAAT